MPALIVSIDLIDAKNVNEDLRVELWKETKDDRSINFVVSLDRKNGFVSIPCGPNLNVAEKFFNHSIEVGHLGMGGF